MVDDKIIIKRSGAVSLNSTPELPIEGLPRSVQPYINTVCSIYHCPREFVTAAVLATAATAVGKKIKINEGKYKNSLVLWFVLVARSGSNKSYPLKLVTKPLRKIDDELFAAYKKKYDDWKSIPNKERNEDEPRCPSIVLDDCTDERRSEILFINNDADAEANEHTGSYGTKRGAIGIYPELKGMFDSKNQYQNGGTAGISKLLRLFDCEDIKVDRRNGFTMLIKDPFCNIIGDLQTGMLKATFGSELFMTNGLNQRFLFLMVENIEYPNRHKAQFERLVREFQDMGINIDRACGDVCRLRCQSYDLHQYINLDAKPFSGVYQEPKAIRPRYSCSTNFSGDEEEKVARLCREIERYRLDLTANYDDWMKIGAALSNLGENGRQWFHLCSSQNSGYNAAECDRKFNNLLRSTRRISLATFFYACKNAGLDIR